ncbi:MAG: hypothetical protein ACYCR7_07075 [Thermoplasmataceae archaeon]
MNSKIKKIGAIAIIVIIALASIAFYENTTEPNGISEVAYHTNFQRWPHSFSMKKSLNYTYLGNRISLVYHMMPGFTCHYLNISTANGTDTSTARCSFQSGLFISNYLSIHSPYSNPVVTVQNISVSINHPLYKNGTNRNDSFGPYGQYSTGDGPYAAFFDLYIYGYQNGGCNLANCTPVYRAVNQGNFTFYENITFTLEFLT